MRVERQDSGRPDQTRPLQPAVDLKDNEEKKDRGGTRVCRCRRGQTNLCITTDFRIQNGCLVYTNSEVCVPISEVKERKKKKKDGNDEERNGKKKSEACEAVSGVKKKKLKKEKDACVDTTESADLTESRKNEELNGKKKETHKTKRIITQKDGAEEEEGVEDEDEEEEEELSPEEQRVLERKLKKIRKKEQKKKQKEDGKSEKEESKSSTAQTLALDYLTCWSEKRDKWKFQKTRQVWLLQHMYDSEKVPDAHFSVLLSYLEGLHGIARELTVHKAEALVRFGASPEGEEDGATEAQKKMQRARKVIQILF
ncbi:uncharacterized protein C7orf50 homolog [Ictalurus furcatus]|uniref:uncharacterized protein C7orf50 homolog n=1 Tax=Ictalurus furcatus TaxID=66913 RepID=UPI002350F30A|nr:uncharacterized protein C7orf50 homolog [Ictalurus furcatus]